MTGGLRGAAQPGPAAHPRMRPRARVGRPRPGRARLADLGRSDPAGRCAAAAVGIVLVLVADRRRAGRRISSCGAPPASPRSASCGIGAGARPAGRTSSARTPRSRLLAPAQRRRRPPGALRRPRRPGHAVRRPQAAAEQGQPRELQRAVERPSCPAACTRSPASTRSTTTRAWASRVFNRHFCMEYDGLTQPCGYRNLWEGRRSPGSPDRRPDEDRHRRRAARDGHRASRPPRAGPSPSRTTPCSS